MRSGVAGGAIERVVESWSALMEGYLGEGDGGQDAFDDVVSGDVVGEGFVGQDHAVAQDVEGEVAHVLGERVAAAPHEGHRLGGQDHVDGGPRAGAVGDVALQVPQPDLGGGTGGGHDAD